MKVLVTGGAGFIGYHVTKSLQEKGHSVIMIDSLITGKEENIPDGVAFYKMDITSPEIETVFIKEEPDVIIHLAAQISVSYSMKNPQEDGKVNIIGTINLLHLSAKYHLKKFIFASSAAVYGTPLNLPIDESHQLMPTSSYGLSKMTSENYIQMYYQSNSLPYTILRFSNVYGPRQTSEGEAGVISIFLNNASQDKPIQVFGNGNQTRDFIYVKDVAEACVQSLELGENKIINIGSETQLSINQLIHSISKISEKPLSVKFESAREGDIEHSSLDYSKARAQLEWSPRYSLEQGLREALNEIQRKRRRSHETAWEKSHSI
ncbi:NAD-dependent epimerase/dehydratase family protein [Rossellomorea sp. YZS02]|uniref:NAD-dependent epimerase/dehydratase family protein n=1 Tax=Rossellomorea sp. YZS02 TaxID=3097358 RepID=UPI002A0E74C4|nr:NAD-dependent epimerase/dehydratase family protein [Rossellomorea sp. YZS02]MDX8343253.1 NAD-dependent epimerase/dehydratase family protein [Rossellomorea sp. YZS02]